MLDIDLAKMIQFADSLADEGWFVASEMIDETLIAKLLAVAHFQRAKLLLKLQV